MTHPTIRSEHRGARPRRVLPCAGGARGSRPGLCDGGAAPCLQDELAMVIRVLHGKLRLDEDRVLWRLRAMFLPRPGGASFGCPKSCHRASDVPKSLPRVKLEDGTLGVPAKALGTFQVPSA